MVDGDPVAPQPFAHRARELPSLRPVDGFGLADDVDELRRALRRGDADGGDAAGRNASGDMTFTGKPLNRGWLERAGWAVPAASTPPAARIGGAPTGAASASAATASASETISARASSRCAVRASSAASPATSVRRYGTPTRIGTAPIAPGAEQQLHGGVDLHDEHHDVVARADAGRPQPGARAPRLLPVLRPRPLDPAADHRPAPRRARRAPRAHAPAAAAPRCCGGRSQSSSSNVSSIDCSVAATRWWAASAASSTSPVSAGSGPSRIGAPIR